MKLSFLTVDVIVYTQVPSKLDELLELIIKMSLVCSWPKFQCSSCLNKCFHRSWQDDYRIYMWMQSDDGQGGLVCCRPWGRKESETTERLNWTDKVSWEPGHLKKINKLDRLALQDIKTHCNSKTVCRLLGIDRGPKIRTDHLNRTKNIGALI